MDVVNSPEWAEETNADMVRIPCLVFFVVTPIFIAIRLWNRTLRGSQIGIDDATLFISFIFTFIVEVLMMLSVQHGFGRHIAALSPQEKIMTLKLFYVAQIFYKLTINLTKISILQLYLRIFVQKWFRVSANILIGIVSMYMVASAGVSIWQCTPISGAWDKSTHPVCVSLTENWYANAGFSIATDILVLLLPMYPIWGSQLPVNQKRALILVFMLGFFGTITSILRSTTLNFSTKSPDTTFDIASTLWTMIEPNIAIICACLPMCRIVLAMILPSVFGQEMSRATGQKSSEFNSSSAFQKSAGGSYIRPNSPASEWGGTATHSAAVASPAKRVQSVSIATHGKSDVQTHSDEGSEEYILGPMSKPGVPEKGNPLSDGDGAIVKTMKFEVAYQGA